MEDCELSKGVSWRLLSIADCNPQQLVHWLVLLGSKKTCPLIQEKYNFLPGKEGVCFWYMESVKMDLNKNNNCSIILLIGWHVFTVQKWLPSKQDCH